MFEDFFDPELYHSRMSMAPPSYRYPESRDLETDRRPAHSLTKVEGNGLSLIWLLEIRDASGQRLGALVMRATGARDSGRLDFSGVSLFTEAEIHGAD